MKGEKERGGGLMGLAEDQGQPGKGRGSKGGSEGRGSNQG